MNIQRTIFFSVLIVAHVFFFCEAISKGHVFTTDSYEYLQQAKNIRDAHSWYCGDFNSSIQPELYSQRPPGYGVFIFLIKKVNDSIWFLLFLQNLLSIFNFYLLYRLLKLLKPKINLLMLLIPLAFFPSQFIYPNLIMSEMLLQTGVILSFYFFARFILLKEVSSVWLYQLFITCSLLIKPIWYLFPFLSLLFFLLMRRQKQFSSQIVFSHLLPIIFVAGIFIYNHKQTSYWEYSSIQRKLMIDYNVYNILVDDSGKAEAEKIVGRMQGAAAAKSNYSEQAGFLQHEINSVLITHPLTFAWVELKGVMRFFIDHSRYDLEYYFSTIAQQPTSWYDDYRANGWSGLQKHFQNFSILFFIYLIFSMMINALLLACLFVFSKLKSIDYVTRIFLVAMIMYTALLTGPTGTTRFRLPVYLLLLLTYAIAFPLVKQWLSKKLFKHNLT